MSGRCTHDLERFRTSIWTTWVVVTIASIWLVLITPPSAGAQARGSAGARAGTDRELAPVSASAWHTAARNPQSLTPWVDAMHARDPWGTRAPSGRAGRAPRDVAAVEDDSLSLPDTDAPLLDFATTLLGRPYRFGADSGAYDCSGFVRRVFGEFGLDLPHSSREQFQRGRAVSRDALQPGDLVFFRSAARGGVSHVGIYAGNDLFVHAARHAGRVRVDALHTPYYAARYVGARRMPVECSLVSVSC